MPIDPDELAEVSPEILEYNVPPDVATLTPHVVPNKIGIIGFTVTRRDAPYGDPSWQLYGCNNLHTLKDEAGGGAFPTEQMAGWFDLHETSLILGGDRPHEVQHREWLEQGRVPVFMWSPQPEWPSSVPFDEERLYTRFSGYAGQKYFTNSISWMVAWAIDQLAPDGPAVDGAELGIWGVDMAVNNESQAEYSMQRPSCEYWVGVADALGIKLTIPQESDLLKSAGQYGRDDQSAFHAKLTSRSDELRSKLAELQQAERQDLSNLEQHRMMMNQIAGALESNEYIRGVWLNPVVSRDGAEPQAAEPELVGAEGG